MLFELFSKEATGRKLPSDSCLNSMKKQELINLLKTADQNYNVLLQMYMNAVNANMVKINQNRQLNREQTRKQKKEEKRHLKEECVTLNKVDLVNIKKDITDKASGYAVETLMSCFALVMARRGQTEDQIAEDIQSINGLFDDVLDGNNTVEDYRAELEELTGIIIKVEE